MHANTHRCMHACMSCFLFALPKSSDLVTNSSPGATGTAPSRALQSCSPQTKALPPRCTAQSICKPPFTNPGFPGWQQTSPHAVNPSNVSSPRDYISKDSNNSNAFHFCHASQHRIAKHLISARSWLQAWNNFAKEGRAGILYPRSNKFSSGVRASTEPPATTTVCLHWASWRTRGLDMTSHAGKMSCKEGRKEGKKTPRGKAVRALRSCFYWIQTVWINLIEPKAFSNHSKLL